MLGEYYEHLAKWAYDLTWVSDDYISAVMFLCHFTLHIKLYSVRLSQTHSHFVCEPAKTFSGISELARRRGWKGDPYWKGKPHVSEENRLFAAEAANASTCSHIPFIPESKLKQYRVALIIQWGFLEPHWIPKSSDVGISGFGPPGNSVSEQNKASVISGALLSSTGASNGLWMLPVVF